MLPLKVVLLAAVLITTSCSEGGGRRSPTVPNGGGPGFQELQSNQHFKKFEGQVHQKEVGQNEVIVAPTDGETGYYLLTFNSRKDFQFKIPDSTLECRYKYTHLKITEGIRKTDDRFYRDIKLEPIKADLIYPKLPLQREQCRNEFVNQVAKESTVEMPSGSALYSSIRKNLQTELMTALNRCNLGQEIAIGTCKNVKAVEFQENQNDSLKKSVIEFVLGLEFSTNTGVHQIERSISLNFFYFSYGGLIRHRGPVLLDTGSNHPYRDIICLDFSLNSEFNNTVCGELD